MDPRAQALKDEGNAAFEAGRNEDAVRLYTSALDFGANAVLLSNRAAAYLKLAKYDKALEDASSAIRVDLSYVKAYARKGTALMSQGKMQEARDAFKAGLVMDPSSALLQEKLRELEASDAAPRSSSAPSTNPSRGAEVLKRYSEMVTDFGLEVVEELEMLFSGSDSGGSQASSPRSPRDSVLTSSLALLRAIENATIRLSLLEKPVIAFWTVISEHPNVLNVTRGTLKSFASFKALFACLQEACSSFPELRAALAKGGRIAAMSIMSAFTTKQDPRRTTKIIELIDCCGDYCATGPLALPDPWGARGDFSSRHPMTVAISHGIPELLSLLVSKGVPVSPNGDVADLPLWLAYKLGNLSIFERLLALGATADMLLLDLSFRGLSWCTCMYPKHFERCGVCPSNKCRPEVQRARMGMLRTLLTRQPDLLSAKHTAADGATWTVLQMAIYTRDAEAVDMVLELGAKPDCENKNSTLSLGILSGVPKTVDLLVNKYKLAEENRQYSDAAIRDLADTLAYAAVRGHLHIPDAGGRPRGVAPPPAASSDLVKLVDIVLGSGLKACWNPNRQNALLVRLHAAGSYVVGSDANTIALLERFRRAGWNVSCWDEEELRLGSGNGTRSLALWAYGNGQRAVAEYTLEKAVCGVDAVTIQSDDSKNTLLLQALATGDVRFAQRLLTVYKAKAAYPGWKFTDQPVFALLHASRLDDAAAEGLLRLLIANTPDLLEMDCYQEKGVPGTRTGTVNWTPVYDCVSPPKPLCLELLLKTVPAAKGMARQRVTTKDATGRFLPDTPLLMAVQYGSWKCAAVLLAHSDATVTERLRYGASSSGPSQSPSPYEAIKKTASSPTPPPRTLIVAFEDAARRENGTGGSTSTIRPAGPMVMGREHDTGVSTNAFEDPSLADGSAGKAKKSNKKSKSGKKKKSRGKKKKAQAGASAAGAAAESSEDDSSSGDDEDDAGEEPDDNLVDSRYAPSLDIMLAERAREQLEAEVAEGEKAAACKK